MKQTAFLKEYIKYVSVNVLGMIGFSCYVLADTFFVAQKLGANGLAALNFSISIFSILQGLGLMVGIGGGTRFAILRSSSSETKRNAVFFQSVLLGLLISAVFILIGQFLTRPIGMLLGARSDTLELTVVYLRIMLSFAPSFVLNNILMSFVRNDANPGLAMTAMLISSFSNILLDYIFIYPLSMGISGAAVATGISPLISMGILMLHFIKKKNSFTLSKSQASLRMQLDILRLGVSAFISELASSITLITFNYIVLRLAGNTGVAAYGVIANIALVASAVFTGAAQGMQPLASRSFGRSDSSSLRKIRLYSTVFCIIAAALIYTGIFMFTRTIVHVFNSESDAYLKQIAEPGLRIYFIGYFFAGLNIVGAAYLSATEKPGNAAVISLLRSSIILVPMVILMGSILRLNGVWLSFVLTEFLVCILCVFFIIRSYKAKRNVC
ncbi:MAG: MATE family efflux transporter [Oscillospiraceae bacterium]|nr:MATE family efflux transporter [Oscillospiraceae bacterium]